MNDAVCVEMRGISKRFGNTLANRSVNLSVRAGEILALLGENGCGKTTLMNVLAGIYYPDEGEIRIHGVPVVIASPKDAYACGIGMIHQHFKLVEVFSAAENVALGVHDGKRYRIREVENAVKQLADRYGFRIDPKKKVHEMSVSEKQTVEILKVLYRGASILILDEPTAVLTPQESEKLFAVLRRMKEDGKSVILITHKLNEVLSLSDRVAVMRKGECVAVLDSAKTSQEELTERMVGQKIELDVGRTLPENPVKRLEVRALSVRDEEGLPALRGVSFTAYGGQILGVAGISGSGQKELLETIAGLRRPDEGQILYDDPKSGETVDLRNKTPLQIRDLGVRLSFVPEDRLGMGLVGDMDLTDNMMLRSYGKGFSLFLDRRSPRQVATRIVEDLQVSTPGLSTPVRKLSGGNVQKVLVGREISSAPSVLMAAYPVRGLDIHSSYTIYTLLNEQKKKGTAVLYVGEDLDVLLELCDRILVLNAGRVAGMLDARSTNKEQVGLLMTRTAPADPAQRPETGAGSEEDPQKGGAQDET